MCSALSPLHLFKPFLSVKIYRTLKKSHIDREKLITQILNSFKAGQCLKTMQREVATLTILLALLSAMDPTLALFGLGSSLSSSQRAKVDALMSSRLKLDVGEAERRHRLRLDDAWHDEDGHLLPWSARLPDPFAPKLSRAENPEGFRNVPLHDLK